MIFKSFLLEQNINHITDKNLVPFYGENLGLINDFKKLIRLNFPEYKLINFNQEEIIKNQESFLTEISNLSLFEKKKIYYINDCNDKILEFIKENEKTISSQLIYFFSNILDKKSKLRSHFEKEKVAAIVACYADNEITIKKLILENF